MPRVEQRRTLFKGPKFDFEEVTLARASGERLSRQMIRHPGAVVVVPVLEEAGERSRLVMIRNQRFTLGREMWEFPAGTLEPPEPPQTCAARELEEEAGYAAATVTPLGRFHTTPGMTDELMHAYLGRGLRHVGQRLMEDEQIRVEVVELRDVLSMIDRAELTDAKSMLALWLAMRVEGLGGMTG